MLVIATASVMWAGPMCTYEQEIPIFGLQTEQYDVPRLNTNDVPRLN